MGQVISLRAGTGLQRCLQVARQIETPCPPDPIMQRSCADCEEKRVTYRNGSGVKRRPLDVLLPPSIVSLTVADLKAAADGSPLRASGLDLDHRRKMCSARQPVNRTAHLSPKTQNGWR